MSVCSEWYLSTNVTKTCPYELGTYTKLFRDFPLNFQDNQFLGLFIFGIIIIIFLAIPIWIKILKPATSQKKKVKQK